MRNSTDASSAFASCGDSYSEESDDDDCQVVGVRPPPRAAATAAAGASPGASQKSLRRSRRSRASGNSSWSAWEVKLSGKRPAKAGTAPEVVDGDQQILRRQWEAATLRRRTCPPMRSEGSKAGTNGHWGSHAPPSHDSLGGESGTAETVQSNGHVSPVKDVSLHALSETTSTSADSVVQAVGVEPRENGDAEPDEVASASRNYGMPESSSNSVFREDPDAPPKVARASHFTDVKKVFKRKYEPEDVPVASVKVRASGTDGASISGYGGLNSLKHMDQGTRDGFVMKQCNQSPRDEAAVHMDNGRDDAAGGSEPASAVEQDIVGAKEKLKETADFKLADQEEWARRQQELQKQAQEARRLRERKRAETDRKNEVELRQKQRLEEIRETQQKEERNMGLKDQIRGKVQADLERLAAGCRDMTTLLRLLHIPVEGGPAPSIQQVNAAYKKALLRYHPDRTSALAQGDPKRQVEAEETFKLITRMKPILKPTSLFTAMTAR